MSKGGPKGYEADYKKLALTLKGDIERFFKDSEADAKDHKEYDPKWLEIAKKRMAKIKSSKPEKAGEEDTDELKKSQQYLVDESIEILLSHESGLVYVDEMLDAVGIDG